MNGIVILNLVAIVLVYWLVFLPRFNKWPKGYAATIKGHPFGYIDDMTFVLFSLAYLSTYLLFAFAFSQIPNFTSLIPVLGQTTVGGLDLSALNSNFTVALVALTAAINIPVIDRTDSRWRSYLLNIARIPREAIVLKTSVLDSLDGLDHHRAYRDYLAGAPVDQDDEAFWRQCIDESRSGLHTPAIHTLSGLHLAHRILELDPKHQDIEYLVEARKRLKEIATILPTLTRPESDLTPESYNEELAGELTALAELYACYVVKKYRHTEERYHQVRNDGFPIARQPPKETNPFVPIVLGGVVLFACCALLSLAGLHFYDAMQVPREDLPWYTRERFYQWTIGSWVSFVMAFGFGIFFNKVLETYYGKDSAISYLLALVFATLGACFFFILARDEFRPHFLWLTVNFGLLSVVTIASLNCRVDDKRASVRKALRYGLYYGLVSMVFSTLLQLHAAGFHYQTSNSVAAATFGLLRGYVIGFFVAYLFIEFNRVQTVADSRVIERLQAGKKVTVGWHGTRVPGYLENLSQDGAQLKIDSSPVSVGDELGLELADGLSRKGLVRWTRGNLAGIRFTTTGRS